MLYKRIITSLISLYAYKIRAHSRILYTENNITDGISCIVIVCTYGTMLFRVRPCHIFTHYYYIRVHVRKCVYFFFTHHVRDNWPSYSEDYEDEADDDDDVESNARPSNRNGGCGGFIKKVIIIINK